MTMMMLARRSIAVVASAAVMTSLVTGVYPLGAQESATKSQAAQDEADHEGRNSRSAGDFQENQVGRESGSS